MVRLATIHVLHSVNCLAPVTPNIIMTRNSYWTVLYQSCCTLVWATKLFGFMWYSPKTLQLLNHIRADWAVWAGDREVNILHEYAKQGQKMAAVYTAVMFLNIFIFVTQPIIPKIIDVLLNNGTEIIQLPIPAYYYHLDVQKYYFHIVLYSYVCVFMMTMVSVTSDIMLIIYVQHGCGIFGALGHKLERMGNNDTSTETRHNPYLDKSGMVNLAPCIDRHNDAIEYATIIEETYTWILLFVVGFGMILINAIGLQILMNTDDPATMPRLVCFAFCIMLHFYIECHICQTLMDHSSSIHFYIHNSQWYKLSTKAQKALQFMAMRCSVPCELTAGHFFIISLRTYGLTFKAAMSYFALARSIRGA